MPNWWPEPWSCNTVPFHASIRIFFLVLLAVAKPALAQLNNDALSDRIAVSSADSNRWGFSVQNLNYLRNTEYFNDIELGRTLFGTQLQPSFFLQPAPHVKLQAGVFLRSDFGASPSVNQVIPTFSLKVTNPAQTRSFTFGTLEGALAHRLAEPLFDINSAIERRIENGAQFKINTPRIFLDTWINWENFIERGSPYKERFTAGVNFTPALLKTNQGFSLLLPLQATAFHRGGQIDADTSNMVMVFNTATGLELKKEWMGSFIKQVSVSGYYTTYRENSNSGYFPWKNGQGVYTNVFADTRWLGVMLSYWQGNRFIAPRGTAIYQSVSTDKPGYTEKSRDLLIIRLLYQKSLAPDLTLSTRFEPVYDLNNRLFDFSYSVYLTYRFTRSFAY